MEEIMNGIMYEIPSSNGVVSAKVTKECVTDDKQPPYVQKRLFGRIYKRRG